MLTLILLIAGFVLFVLAGVPIRSRYISTRYSFGWLGLACWILTVIVGHGGLILR
jgi:hypothetical protein